MLINKVLVLIKLVLIKQDGWVSTLRSLLALTEEGNS